VLFSSVGAGYSRIAGSNEFLIMLAKTSALKNNLRCPMAKSLELEAAFQPVFTGSVTLQHYEGMFSPEPKRRE
jgi:hypothetical protein